MGGSHFALWPTMEAVLNGYLEGNVYKCLPIPMFRHGVVGEWESEGRVSITQKWVMQHQGRSMGHPCSPGAFAKAAGLPNQCKGLRCLMVISWYSEYSIQLHVLKACHCVTSSLYTILLSLT